MVQDDHLNVLLYQLLEDEVEVVQHEPKYVIPQGFLMLIEEKHRDVVMVLHLQADEVLELHDVYVIVLHIIVVQLAPMLKYVNKMQIEFSSQVLVIHFHHLHLLHFHEDQHHEHLRNDDLNVL